MPYCPKCDMEFIDGVTTCSDCGETLVASEEVAKAMKKEEQEKLAKEREIRHHERELYETDEEEPVSNGDTESTDFQKTEKPAQRAAAPSSVYIKKSQKYEDLKSSASAFILVGVVLLAASILCWLGIVNLPMTGIMKLIFQGALTAMALFSIGVAINSTSAAKKLAPQIQDEDQKTRDLIHWFTDHYDANAIDREIEASGDLAPEELSLKRFQIIQDHLTTAHDLPDPTYVDALSEEIYATLYE